MIEIRTEIVIVIEIVIVNVNVNVIAIVTETVIRIATRKESIGIKTKISHREET